MHYTGEVYRHPMEGYTPLLEVTIGCSHNECTFCTMYRETPFRVSPTEHIKEDLQELKSVYGHLKRINLVNADPFALSSDKLGTIASLVIEAFPDIETITCYASIKNLKNKSVDDLKMLKALRYNDLHIGIETAYAPALKMMNKGFTVEDAYTQLSKLKAAGFRYDALLMLGSASKGNSEINVRETAKLLNETQPYMVSIMPTSVTLGSELEVLCKNGEYIESTELEMLEEEMLLIRSLKLEDSYFFGSHNFNLVPISGNLNTDKDKILTHIDEAIKTIDPSILNGVKPRGSL
ncbi:MAG: radical SAM protein [Peptostreptococcaceae bacterium]|nr:radical SAM protein [Peptostreptococcaceae bacterium]